MEKLRKRNWTMLLYPEDPTHAAAIETLEQGGFKYAAILHDKDQYQEGESPDHEAGETKKAHWHVVLKFAQAVWNTSLAKQLGIAENYIQPCSNLDGALLYLVHSQNEDKYQYEVEAVFGPLVPALKKLLVDDDEGTRLLAVLDEIDRSPSYVDYRKLLRSVINNNLYGEFRRGGTLITRYIDEHNREMYDAEFEEKCKRNKLGRFDDYISSGGSRLPFPDRCDILTRKGFPPKPMD